MKTYVFDASALLVYLQNRASAQKIAELLKAALRDRALILMSAVNFGEVYSVIAREFGETRAAATINAVRQTPIRLLDANPQRSLHAAETKNRYKLYYVDSFAAALAIEHKATLVTSDSDFRKLGHTFSIVWLKI